jgi:hypothetical protein
MIQPISTRLWSRRLIVHRSNHRKRDAAV